MPSPNGVELRLRRLEKADERRQMEILAILRTLGRNAQEHADFRAELRRMAQEQQRMAQEQHRMAQEQLRMAQEQQRMARDMKRFAEEQERLAKEQKRIAEEQTRQGDRLDASIKALYRLLEHRLS